MRHWRGYTVIEVMITLAMLGVVTALAVPSFRELIDRNHLSATANDLVSAFLTTRSEAVKRECKVSIRSISGSDAWEAGWTAGVLTDVPAGCTALELVRHETSSKMFNIATNGIAANGGISNEVIYYPDGRADGLTGGGADYFTLTLIDPLTLNAQTRTVCLTQNGRPYVPQGGSCP